jgi:hypothetical protein
MGRNNLLIWPPEFHWDKHSSSTNQRRKSNMSISKSIPEIDYQASPKTKIKIKEFRKSILETSIRKCSNLTQSEPNLEESSSNLKSNPDIICSNFKTLKKMKRHKTPLYLLTVNSKSQLIYTLLYHDKNDISGDIVGSSETVHEFNEIISNMIHLPSIKAIILCGSPHLFFWSVSERRLLYKHKIEIPTEPWFSIWDGVYISSKQSLILGLNNGFLLQLKFNISKMNFEEMRIFQSNEKGMGIYSLAYFPIANKIIATNGDNLLTEFVFQVPKTILNKGLFLASSRNISYLPGSKESNYESRSIRDISLEGSNPFIKFANSENTNKNRFER